MWVLLAEVGLDDSVLELLLMNSIWSLGLQIYPDGNPCTL